MKSKKLWLLLLLAALVVALRTWAASGGDIAELCDRAIALVANGEIKLCSGVEVARLTEHDVVLTDGREIAADLVVYATGYGSMNQWAAALISREVADKVGKCWGLGSQTAKDPGPWEGELRNMWKPTAQDGLWFHGGNLAQSRHYSRYLALQLKARLEGLPTPVYGRGPVYHKE